MPFLISSDWHMSDNPRDAYRFKIIRRVVPDFVRHHNVKALFNLGDLTESKDAHKAELVNDVVDLFYELAQLCPIYILRGNHDWLSSPDSPFFAFLKHIPNITWINTPTSVPKLCWAWPTNRPALFLPHSGNFERDWSDIPFHKYELVFAHQTFTGAKGDAGNILTGVPLSFFPPNVKIISGDVHRPQSFANVTYVGAPYAVDFGDSYGGEMLLLEDKTLSVVHLPVDGPQKRLIEVNSMAELKRVGDLAKGDILKVRLKVAPEAAPNWANTVAAVREWGAKQGLVVHQVSPVSTATPRRMISQRSTAVKKDGVLLKEYAAARAVDESTTKVGLKLL